MAKNGLSLANMSHFLQLMSTSSFFFLFSVLLYMIFNIFFLFGLKCEFLLSAFQYACENRSLIEREKERENRKEKRGKKNKKKSRKKEFRIAATISLVFTCARLLLSWRRFDPGIHKKILIFGY